MRVIILDTNCTDPVHNLAYEEYMLRYAAKESCMILYLWQNDNAVIIGRNQNAYTEANLANIEKNHAKLVRRLTGGGAVYHDLGNLNFTFLMPRELYNISETTKIIVESMQNIGFQAEVSGRNDILINGYKFSGNAYYSNEHVGMHHGTIMVDVDVNKMKMMLTPSGRRKSLKGIRSVKSRVVNLTEIAANVSIEAIKASIKNSFRARCCAAFASDVENSLEVDPKTFHELYCRYVSRDWNIGLVKEYSVSKRNHFDWGNLNLSFEMEDKNIYSIALSSDSLYPNLIDTVTRDLNKLDNKQLQVQELFARLIRENTETHLQKMLMDIESTYLELLKSLEV